MIPSWFSRRQYFHAWVEGKHYSWGYDPLDQVSWTEPSNHKAGSDVAYTLSLVQSPILWLKRLCTALKYLRLWFDGKITFEEHTKWKENKVERIATSISQLVSNLGGLSEGKCKLLVNIVMLVLLYGTIWADVINTNESMNTKKKKKKKVLWDGTLNAP